MPEYIEREKLLKKAIEEKRFVFKMEDILRQEIVIQTVYKDLAEFILSAPAADVAPVRHGFWKNQLALYKCSNCKVHQIEQTQYCPNCGAKMDLED